MRPSYAALLAGILAFALGCETADVNYMGKTYPPTKALDVYYSKTDVPAGYAVMGRAIVTAPEDLSGKQIQDKIMKEAEAAGADAVLVGEAREVKSGVSTDWAVEQFGPLDTYDGFGWGYGPGDWGMLGPVHYITPLETTYNYALKIKVLYLKKQ
jgi:hypothetical protein